MLDRERSLRRGVERCRAVQAPASKRGLERSSALDHGGGGRAEGTGSRKLAALGGGAACRRLGVGLSCAPSWARVPIGVPPATDSESRRRSHYWLANAPRATNDLRRGGGEEPPPTPLSACGPARSQGCCAANPSPTRPDATRPAARDFAVPFLYPRSRPETVTLPSGLAKESTYEARSRTDAVRRRDVCALPERRARRPPASSNASWRTQANGVPLGSDGAPQALGQEGAKGAAQARAPGARHASAGQDRARWLR